MNKNILIREMVKDDIITFYTAFKEQGWNKPVEIFEKYYREQEEKKRKVIVAEIDGEPVGYTTLLHNDQNGPFANMNIPTVCDFNVLVKWQGRGIGTLILDEVEKIVAKTCDKICLGVGLHNGYGSAQRLYVKRGYVPDGTGVWYNDSNLKPYSECKNNDDLILYMSKQLILTKYV